MEVEFEEPGALLLVANPSRNPVLCLRLQNQSGRQRINSFVSALSGKGNRKIESQMQSGRPRRLGTSARRFARRKKRATFSIVTSTGILASRCEQIAATKSAGKRRRPAAFVIPVKRHSRDPRQGLFFFGDPFGAIFLRAKIAQSRKTIKQPGHPVGRSILGGLKLLNRIPSELRSSSPP